VSFSDRTLQCRDCSKSFVFTVEEQEVFANKGFSNDPSRCVECREARKARISAQTVSGYGGSQSNGGNTRREYTKATCASCGGEAMVPFVPRGDKPVYCSNCFEKVRSYR
jgi:CxxC-x17-CxxC domain-containing protein